MCVEIALRGVARLAKLAVKSAWVVSTSLLVCVEIALTGVALLRAKLAGEVTPAWVVSTSLLVSLEIACLY